MFQPQSINSIGIQLIKILAPIVMVVAMGVDGAIARYWQQGLEIPKSLIAIGALGTVALVAHSIEGIVAAFMAKQRGLNPLRFGLYTFFVGTVAFIDLFDSDKPELGS